MSKYNLIDIYEEYQIGSGWTRDFDYDGMLKAGLKTGVDTDIELLKKMVEDYTDVNYHREAHHLYKAIEALEEGAIKEASMFFGDFHDEIKATMEEQGMDIEPTVGQFMASKMEEGEEVEEVTSREGSRIESLLSQPLKAKFLNAFEDLYFDLVDEDPFHAEDVIDHLGIEMIKHLDAIQAQGDKLAGIENPSVEFTPGERIGEEEIEGKEEVDEAMMPRPSLFKGTETEIQSYLDSLKREYDKDKEKFKKDYLDFSDDDWREDFGNYAADKALQEHFGRFMKDYQ